MRILKIIFPLSWLVLQTSSAGAQNIHWRFVDSTQYMIHAVVGLDYSLSFGLGYAYKLNVKPPILLHTQVSIPSGEKTLDDYKIKFGGQMRVFKKSQVLGSISVSGIYRKYETSLATLHNLGSDVKASIGYYKQRWFIAAEFGIDKAIATQHKHTQVFKDEMYPDVVDGWYGPATGANLYYGLAFCYTRKKTDIVVHLGKIVSQDFKSAPLVPFYFSLSLNHRFTRS